ncbi:MAG: phosphatase PAP2 family protein [Turicibacter sp.]|nr:phosphatase PAP2 family protein [Turicibacter sp.]
MELLWFLEGLRTPFWDAVFSQITTLGEETILIVVFCLVFWCVNKKAGYVLGTSFFLSALAVQGLKTVFRVPRPWVSYPDFLPVGYAIDAATGYSFPSGHTQNAAVLWGL